MKGISALNANKFILAQINRFLDEPNPLSKKQIKNNVLEGLNESAVSILTKKTRGLLLHHFNYNADTIADYSYIAPKPGRTYLLTANTGQTNDIYGTVFFLNVIHSSSNNSLSKSYSYKLKPAFDNALQSVMMLAKKYNKKVYFASDFEKYFDYFITDRFGKPSDAAKGVEGNSASLSFAVALLSLVFNRELTVEVACTGDLAGTEVKPVNYFNEKLTGLGTEFDEPKKYLYPGNENSNSIKHFENIEPIPVSSLEEVISYYFPDYKELLRNFVAPGAASYHYNKVVRIASADKSKELQVNGCQIYFKITQGEKLEPAYLSVLNEIDCNTMPSCREIVIVNNARASWHIGFLIAQLKNFCTRIAIYDPKLFGTEAGTYAHFVSPPNDPDFKLGEKIWYEVGDLIL